MKQRLIDSNALHYRMGVNQDDEQIWRTKAMKVKKIIALAALILALCGCGTSAAASEQDSWDNDFRMDWIADEGSFGVYQDQETGVQYIVFWHSYGFGITPRYNADGTLYQGGAHE